MENPYWHDELKPHPIDFDEVRRLCFEAYTIIAASHSMAGLPGKEVGGTLHEFFWKSAEPRLSFCLLNIAIRMRTFEDTLEPDTKQAYDRLLSKYAGDGELGSLGWHGKKERVELSYREACNKLIHSEDFRPTYDNGSNASDDDFAWGMTGVVELMGRHGKHTWDVWLNVDELLSTILEVAAFADTLPKAK